MPKNSTRSIVLSVLSVSLIIIARILSSRQDARMAANKAAFERHITDLKRGNKELEAFSSHLDDKIEAGKFWLQVTDSQE